MSRRLTGLRVVALSCAVVGWVAACGSADTATTTQPVCFIYYGGGTIPDPPDGEQNCPTGECNYQSQQGCTAAQNCVPHYDATTDVVSATCRPAGTQQIGDVCNDTA